MTDNNSTTSTEETAAQYRVLARKYRPATFSEMIGQEAMVRVLTNAVSSGRLAHAFMLTGVRGVGKTTTARVLARGLNCIGPDGTADFGPTVEPCGVCEHCVGIAEDRHVDVLEMDAASRTGVDDMRELIEGVRYRPTSARYKVYIIDEVHMLSKSAFNALLKTLEEPPEHVKFIFATTEIRKVPVTVLSRCQRFDLRRVEVDVLATYFNELATKEGATVDDTAIQLIARAADGSVRDGLSLLDQAISHTTDSGDTITEDQIREMLGLADRSQSFDTFDALMKGDAAAALDVFAAQYTSGADPAQIIEDLLGVTHWLTRLKVSPAVADDVAVPEIERVRGKQLSSDLGMAAVTRAWQMLLKGLTEVRHAPSAVQAAEMVLIRLAHASTLPSPEEALKALSDDAAAQTTTTTVPSGGNGGGASAVSNTTAQPTGNGGGAQAALSVVSNIEPEQIAVQADEPETTAFVFTDFAHIAERATQCREGKLAAFLGHNARLVKFEPGRLEINGGEFADEVTMRRLRMFLQEQSGMEWVIINSTEAGAATLVEVQAGDIKAALDKATAHPLVQAVLETFPDASVESIERIEHNEHVEQNNEDDPTE
ncbi:MAG: DNA polymerase III subunit gamma/tau [Rhodospirillales bacterium]|nr:DNA polymerase III subunit gamma/tau [Rhodospirillales bacterium]MBT4626935.1 DNA polymerase III subunit gamma/tau [Rhodospirillales bacterium]MBT5352473.1 DNA polymerase III subunit gamma/tau [Rhodospirillales bacterium]MBT5521088.1 DNA polymerase III subunit gamma/tau [Rhodospirillales bacterium]MBT6111164.1 DNA polymerase III subunit gamma/tau [Rhodospirillales bacterium]